MLQEVAAKRLKNGRPDPAVIEQYRLQFGAAICGERYRKQLEALWEQRHSLARHLRRLGYQYKRY